MLRLPQSQVKTRHVTSLYIDILQSKFGQMFLESLLTVTRFEEGASGLKGFVQGEGEIGLQAISMEDAMDNVLYLLGEMAEKGNKKEGNVLFRESGWLLPIAEEMISSFDLPIQNNAITLLMVYIETNKGRIRRKISSLDYTLQGNELGNGQTQYALKKSEMRRIIGLICRHGNSNHIWELIEQTMNFKVGQWAKLWECLTGYGAALQRKVRTVGEKILETLREGGGKGEEGEKLTRLHDTYHVVSKLVTSCKEEIKQFYFINKQILHEFIDDSDSLQGGVVVRPPDALKGRRQQLLTCPELMQLTEAMMYFVRVLRDCFNGRVEDRMLVKLLHYPKMVVEAAWYYVFIFTRQHPHEWSLPSQVETFFEQHPRIGSHPFSSLLEVFNLVLPFLNLESFCSSKFKQLFMPVLIKNPQLAREISLRFKVPSLDQDMDTQNILVTRECSFDMALYQVVGEGISV